MRTHKLNITGVYFIQRPGSWADGSRRTVAPTQVWSEQLNTKKRMKQTITLLIGLALAGSALTVSAQQGQGRGVGGPHRYGTQNFPPPIAATLDADGNGVLSEAEISQAPSQLLKLDKNRDNQLTAEELCPGGFARGSQDCPWGSQGRGRSACANGQKSVLLAILDADRDGVLTSAEINGAPAALKALDKNSDGQITAAEIRPLPGCGRGRGCPCNENQAK